MSSPLFTEDQTEYVRPDGITVIRRRAFAAEYFDLKPGEHVAFGGPSTRGKTTLAFDLLEYCVNPDFPAYVAVSKPQDPVTERRGRELGFRRVSEWPPPKKIQELSLFGAQKPSGYLIWSQFGDLNTDMDRSGALTEKLLSDRYSHGASKKNTGGILVMDDTMVKGKIQGLDSQMVTILAMAGAMHLSMWVFVQRPADSGRTTLWGYEMASHMFFTKAGDRRMLMRYAEIIGDKGQIAMHAIPTLKPYQFFYVNKNEGYVCIVDAN